MRKKAPSKTRSELEELKNLLDQKNRELEVEAALERIRSSAMAMNKTDKLAKVVKTIFQELKNLNFDPAICSIGIYNKESKGADWWISDKSQHMLPRSYHMPYMNDPWSKSIYSAWKNQLPVHTYNISGKAKLEQDRIHFEQSDLKYLPESTKNMISSADGFDASYVSMKHGMLEVVTEESLSKNQIQLLQRLGKVIDLTYTRFLDLQKAEAQVREAQIEAALERVRVRSMAMHKGDELADTAMLLFKQFTDLGIYPRSCGFLIMDEPTKTMEDWSANLDEKGKASLVVGTLKFDQHPMISKVVATWRRGDPYFIGEIHGSDLQKYYKAITLQESTSNAIKDQILAKTQSEYTNSFYFKYGMMYVLTKDPLKEDDINLLLRFAGVFKMTYTRFLDLQKAEAQAREAEIQLALERVRARTMAMHKSEELSEVVALVYEHIQSLGFSDWGCSIIICDEKARVMRYWYAEINLPHLPEYCNVPLTNKIVKKAWKLWQSGVSQFDISLLDKEKESYTSFMLTETDYHNILPEEVKEEWRKPKDIFFSYFTFKYGMLEFVDIKPLNSENHPVYERFAKVFEQTYTRFLDLQKAEAQAREAEIQLALERVRARSMAMNKSEELIEVAAVLYEQLNNLQIPHLMTGYALVDESREKQEIWMTDLQGNRLDKFYLPLHGDEILKERYENWKQKTPVFHQVVSGKRLRQHLDFVSKHFELSEAEEIAQNQMPEQLVFYCGNFSLGYLHIHTEEPLNTEQESVLYRLTQAFSLTYTRFLDLQKAEAQAREAQIEAALERVRAASMAMHKSDELSEVALTFLDQVDELIPLLGVAISIVNVENETCVTYLADNTKEAIQELLVSNEFRIDQFWMSDEAVARMKAGEKEFTVMASSDKIKSWIKWISNELSKDRADRIRSANLKKAYFHCVQFHDYSNVIFSSLEPLADDYRSVIRRLMTTFKMSYLRFLDLQKAEAQAREAQIEAALERVRSRTLALQNSDELLDAASLMFQQLQELGGNLFACGFVLVDKDKPDSELWMSAEGKFQPPIVIPNNKEPVTGNMFKAWKEGSEFYVEEAGGEALTAHYNCLLSIPKTGEVFQGMLDAGISFPTWQRWHAAYFTYGYLLIITTEPFEDVNLFVRFAKVFDQTYTRFLDLQKVEAQAREAEIQLALERVRARSMAMHKSEELAETAAVLFQQFDELGVKPERINIGIVKEEERIIEWWSTEQGGKQINQLFKGSIDEATTLSKVFSAWKKGKRSLVLEQSGKELTEWLNYLTEELGLPFKNQLRQARRYQSASFFTHGMILMSTPEPLSEETLSLLPRFAKVFEQTYTRFLDLQKAEAQAREAQIETALERIRNRSLLMMDSGELNEVVAVLFQELSSLGLLPPESRTYFCDINSQTHEAEVWMTYTNGEVMSGSHITPLTKSASMKKYYKAWKLKEPINVREYKGKNLSTYLSFISTLAHVKKDKDYRMLLKNPPKKVVMTDANFLQGNIGIMTFKSLSQEALAILVRFAKVFEFTYTRFLDLQKAEAQAREAQIEAALERIRAKALAMQNSADLHDVSIVLRDQMGLLGQPDLESSIVHLYNSSQTLESWYTFRSTETDSDKIVTDVAIIPVDSCEYIRETLEKYHSKETEYTIISKGKKLRDWYKVMVKVAPDTIEYDEKGKMIVPDILYYHHSKFSGGALLLISNQPPSEESKELQQRAARVFNFAYQRFLDLKKAESQAREAQIEAALERVRSKAMAMQHSEDLSQSVATTLDELEKLKLHIDRCGVGIFNLDNKTAQLWTTTNTAEGKQAIVLGEISLLKHPMVKGSYDAWRKKQGYSHILEGDDLRDYYTMLKDEGFKLPANSIEKALSIERQYYNYFSFPAGGLYVISGEPLSDEEGNIVQRFADVFHLAFTRYLDLQNAEARAVEAIKQASLDRVRAEIASMRTANDLQRITPLIWSELTTLGVPFIRCGVFIMDDEHSVMQSYLSTPDGKSLGVYDLPYEATEIAKKLVKRWRNKKAYKEHWDKKQFLKFMETMAKRGLIQNQQLYQGDTKPPDSLDLHFVPFKQGMLYAGNAIPLSEDELFLLKSLAEAFSIAYSRYEDFTRLEEAKTQTEKAFSELKSTQTQLIHAEKMASLGELTAGIAHEIQNPLNFVNNFSEVSKELIEEMNEEMEAGNMDEVKEITDDLKQNLDKINHHGQRASSIVKGMLEHSRTGNRQKELTDINMLADEYLRLAYHGLRAKDKSFNADFKTSLDEKLPKVKVISQDIGRVLLNMINNAFYAVSSNSKSIDGKLYKPEVTVSTKRNDQTIEICIQDNGGGIPKGVLDKIFQPFFTTKPTGEGTGLGLSLSYDIITKGHDGHLEVETEEGIGTRFIVQLPIST